MTDASPERNIHAIRPAVLDERQICDEIERHLGRRPATLVQHETKLPRFVYEARFDDRPSVILKAERDTSGDDAIVLEAWALEQVAAVGVPASRVLALDATSSRFLSRYAIFSFVDGVPLSSLELPAGELQRLLRESGELLRRVHSVRVEGFGRLDDDLYLETGIVRGRFDRWIGDAARAALLRIAGRELLTQDEAHAIGELIGSQSELLDEYADGRLLHGDFDASHIYVDPATPAITGLIDFGDRESGDPLWDLSLFAMGRGTAPLRALLAGHSPDVPEGETGRTLAVYAVLRLLNRASNRINEGREDEVGWFIDHIRRATEVGVVRDPSWASLDRLFRD